MEYTLPDLNLLKINSKISDDQKTGVFELEPLSPGYGITVGNTLRRILLSSLEGAAIESLRIEGVDHEFSAIKGVKEDAVEVILNLKTARFKLDQDESAKLELSVKGPKVVTTADFKKNSAVEALDEDHYIATVEKGGALEIEIEVGKGRGYLPVEKKGDIKLPIGTILVDSIYTPVKKVKYDIDNARVGGMTNYNKLTLEITTDGSITPVEALSKAVKIMSEHLQVIEEACQSVEIKASKPKKVAKKATVKKVKEDK